MGLAGLSFWHILTVLIVFVLVFGTKKLGSVGSDLGEAIKNFRKAMATDEEASPQESQTIDKPAAELRSDPPVR